MDGMLGHHRVTPSIKFAGTHLKTWVERGTVRVNCLTQEHNTMFPVRAHNAPSGAERTNHEATAPLQLDIKANSYSDFLVAESTQDHTRSAQF